MRLQTVICLMATTACLAGTPGARAEERRPAAFFAYRSFWPEFEAMRQFKNAGVNTVCVFAANTDNSLGQPYSKYPPVWRWFGKYDFGSLDRQYDDVIAVNPQVEFIAMIDLNTPIWLQRQLSGRGHSAECESFTMLSSTCANAVWRKATSEYLAAVLAHLEERYGDRIKAYLLACGSTDEWLDQSQGSAGRAKARAWKSWRAVAGKPAVAVPELERLDRATLDNFLRAPNEEQDIVDYAQFTGESIVDAILGFAEQTRKAVDRKRQIGVFFGYILELTTSRLVWAGHLEYERLLRSPAIDFTISPGTYGDRPMGGGSGFMSPSGTRRLYGKGHLHEIDHRTPTYNVQLDDYVAIAWMVPWKDQAETDAGLKREFALAIVNQTSLWCFDMWGGVFKTPETMRVVTRAKQLWDRFGDRPLAPRAEVALIADPHSARYVNDRHPWAGKVYQGTRNKLNRLGAPFEVFSFDDLARVDLTPYRLVVLPGTFVLTPEKRAVLEKRVLNNNRSVVFVYAPGICDGVDLDPDRVQALTGASFKAPGVSSVQRDGWRAIYLPDYDALTPAVLKRAAAEAGVTLVCDDEVPVYANERLLAIHTASGGERTIRLRDDCRQVRELFSDRVIEVAGRRFSYTFNAPDTALFELVP